jgi:putative peptidoglycan lipid II flippase
MDSDKQGSAEKDGRHSPRTRWHAFLVASGMMLSRIAGLVRVSVFAFFFGSSDAADAFNAAFRIPNFLQNLFGEGVLSASFIPVYANLLARGDREEARRVAGAVAALLMLVTSILVLLGVLITPWLIAAIAPGFSGSTRPTWPPSKAPSATRGPRWWCSAGNASSPSAAAS